MIHKIMKNRFFSVMLTVFFIFSVIVPSGFAQKVSLGNPTVSSPFFVPPLLKGVMVNFNQPFNFDFILDVGSSVKENDSLYIESNKLLKYFLAS